MNTIIFFLITLGLYPAEDRIITTPNNSDFSQELIGAWEAMYADPVEGEIRVVTIVADGYVSATHYTVADNKFISTDGSSWSANGNSISKTIEYNTADPSMVGKELTTTFFLEGNTLKIEGDEKIWKRLDYGTPGALAGAYLITGRKRDGEITSRTPGARKTMKILSGRRFQWIAYNTDSGKFFGTGGGTYTTVTENTLRI